MANELVVEGNIEDLYREPGKANRLYQAIRSAAAPWSTILLAVIEHHQPYRAGKFVVCEGCDFGDGDHAAAPPNWPCSTIVKIHGLMTGAASWHA